MSIYKDYIISLVGTNPLPNYITALNYLKKDSTIILVCTESASFNVRTTHTEVVARRLRDAILRQAPNVNICIQKVDKSDFSHIKESTNKIINLIKENCNYDNLGDLRKEALVDYTGGTKTMAALFYSSFKEIETSMNKIDFAYSYVSSQEKVIFEEGINYEFDDIIGNYNIAVNDIARLHGYQYKEDEHVFQGEYGDIIAFDNVFLKDFRIATVRGSKIKKELKNEIKYDIFKLKIDTEKVAGTESFFFYVNKDINVSDRNEIKDKLLNYSDFDGRKRFELLIENEDVEEILENK